MPISVRRCSRPISSFKTPTGSELSEQKVIATSDKFALNSQVAMMFYDDDANVRSTYQRFYMLGTDSLSWDPMAQRAEGVNKTITGGAEQKNDSHYIELLAACAALDFYNTNDERLKEKKQTRRHRLYLSCHQRRRTFRI